jgi:hypothetical protein
MKKGYLILILPFLLHAQHYEQNSEYLDKLDYILKRLDNLIGVPKKMIFLEHDEYDSWLYSEHESESKPKSEPKVQPKLVPKYVVGNIALIEDYVKD